MGKLTLHKVIILKIVDKSLPDDKKKKWDSGGNCLSQEWDASQDWERL